MVKGVHKQMIEIQQTGHPYFERAIFIVRADKAYLAEREKQLAARRLLERLTRPDDDPPAPKPAAKAARAKANRRMLYGVMKFSGAVAAGAVAAALLLTRL